MMRYLRSAAIVAASLLLISLIAESIEFAVVTLVHGQVTTDQEVYFSVRNTPPVLGAKLVYNALAGFAGGYVASRLAPRAPLLHGIAVAVVQVIAFAWALGTPEIRQTMPDPAWGLVIAATIAGIVAGAFFHARTYARRVAH